jgi:hypothetical protein
MTQLAVNGWVYLEIRKGMYRLKQAGLLPNHLLQKRLKPFGYHPARHTPSLWLHSTKPMAFSLVIDNFAAKYITEADARHPRNALLRQIISLLNYFNSQKPRARQHGRTDKSKRPESHPAKERARARLRCCKTEPNY